MADPAEAARTAAEPAAGEPAPGRSNFLRFVVSQTTSMLGTSLTGFALGVWVFQTTGSVTRFALITFCTLLPGILLSPIAGALVDRWDRRKVMIVSDLGSGLCSLALALLLWQDALQIWHIYALLALSSTLGAPQMLAFSASIPLLVPKSQLSRANGVFQLGMAASDVGAPAIGGALLAWAGVEAALLVDFATCLVAVGLMLFLRIPRPRRTQEAPAGKKSLLAEAAQGWTFIRARPGLLGLLLTFAALNLSRGSVMVLITPLVLGFANPQVLGRVLALGSLGMVVGGILMTVWGGPRRRMHGIYAAIFLYGVMLFLGGLRPDALLITLSAFLLLFTGPFINGLGQSLWHVKVPPDLQGRVSAMRRLVSWSSLPLAALVSGPLSDRLFEPLMAPGGALAGSLGGLFGTGAGRGVGLFMSLQGIAILGLFLVCWLYRPLRRLEEDTPDMVDAGTAELEPREPAAAASS